MALVIGLTVVGHHGFRFDDTRATDRHRHLIELLPAEMKTKLWLA